MFRLLIDRFEDSLQQSAGNLQTDQSHLERYFENSYSYKEIKKRSQKGAQCQPGFLRIIPNFF